jgi:hypothetical protein
MRTPEATRLPPFPDYIIRAMKDLKLDPPKYKGETPSFLEIIGKRKTYYEKLEMRETEKVDIFGRIQTC